VEDLLLDADAAMYRAKAQGRARSVVFRTYPCASARPHLFELEGELRHALLREEFRVHYLPSSTWPRPHPRSRGFDSLGHPTRGLIAPEHFVPFAEETGLMVPIGRWLLGQAGREFQSCAAPRRSG